MSRHNFSGIPAPSVNMNRTKIRMPHGKKTSMSVGTLYPLDLVEVLPGDTFSDKVSAVARVTSSYLKPVMDNSFLDIYHFFVPLRLCYENAEQVFGKASPSMYEDDILDSLPISGSQPYIQSKTVGDYLGLPVGYLSGRISVCPFRAFALIYNEWFRNENVIDEVYVQKGDYVLSENPNNLPWSPNNYTGKLPKVRKNKDYFTSALPQPQKGQAVDFPLASGSLPVVWADTGNNTTRDYRWLISRNDPDARTSMVSDTQKYMNSKYALYVLENSYNPIVGENTLISGGANVYPDLSKWEVDTNSLNAVTVNDLRLAFATQRMLEVDSLYGSRYNEYLLGHFGVTNPDARLQLPEYLGGARIPINVQQVAQTSQGNEESPLANVAGYSLSNGKSRYSKGFTEHGYIITVGCIRTLHTYQQGIHKLWSRRKREHFYDPLMANIGEQPIYTSELYAFRPYDSSPDALRQDVFGYQEAFAEYRYLQSQVTGEMRSNVENSLDIWHFADDYSSAPVLGKEFVEETPVNMDRTLSVPSSSQDQFIVDLWFDTTAIRVMPLYSIPSLSSHR